MTELPLSKILAAQRMLDAASVPQEHRRTVGRDETGVYMQCTCGLRTYLDEDADD